MIAVRILQELQHSTQINIAALPLVGEGRAYTQLGIPLIGAVQTMPSGGFIYMDGRQLVRDVHGGLLKLTLSQIKAVRRWARSQVPKQESKVILAVGDIVPLLFAWISGANYAFIGTAKSEYYLRDETEILPKRWGNSESPLRIRGNPRHNRLNFFEGWSGSVYLPWERWLMLSSRCKAVFPRDSLTTKTLQKWSIPAFDLGNPMMDQLDARNPSPIFSSSNNTECQEQARALTIVLLPGSRPPEAYANWQQIMVAVAALGDTFSERWGTSPRQGRTLLFLGAIAPSLSLEPLCQILLNANFIQVSSEFPFPDPEALTFKYKNALLILSQHAYNDCLQLADIAIAMAGTATEQFVGLGKPAITFPGKGPQFTYAFAEAQTRLLGSSLILIDQPTQVADVVQSLLRDPDRLQLIAENGWRRMGKPGAARRIAACLLERFEQS